MPSCEARMTFFVSSSLRDFVVRPEGQIEAIGSDAIARNAESSSYSLSLTDNWASVSRITRPHVSGPFSCGPKMRER